MRRIWLLFVVLLVLGTTQLWAQPVIPYFQGFEIDKSGWFENPNTLTRVTSGTGGITSSAGSYHATIAGSGAGGAFTRFGGYSDTWPTGGFVTSLDIYLDTSWLDGTGFDYSVAANGTDGNHQRDFIFHVGKVGSDLIVNGSNNSDFFANSFKLNNENGGFNYTVGQSGWYTFQHVFYNNSGVLAVDLNLLNSSGTQLWSVTRSGSADLIPSVVGGNRYGWFTFVDTQGGVAIDNTSLVVIPEPSTFILFGCGLLGAGIVSWRRKRA